MQKTTFVFLHMWNMTYFEEFRHIISSSIDLLKSGYEIVFALLRVPFKKNSLKKYFYSSGSIHISNIYENTFFSKGWWWCLTLKNLCFLLFNELFNKQKILFFSFANILKCSYILYSGNPLCMNFAFWEYAINGHLRIL